MPTNIVVSGASGRMGQTLVRLIAENPELHLIGGVDREHKHGDDARALGFAAIETAAGAGAMCREADVVIDFSAVEGLQNLLAHRGEDLRGRALVVGTTGLPAELTSQLEAISRNTAVLVAANFSIGVNLLLGLAEAAARVLGGDTFDVEIVEAHHNRKVDAPSGTALALGQAVARGRAVDLATVRRDSRSGNSGKRPVGEIGFHALRGGDIVGEHTVHFIGARERVELTHKAQDRALFAEGALLAARWIAGKQPGLYSMKDVLGLDIQKPGN